MDKYLHVCSSFKPGGITNFVKGIIDQNKASNTIHHAAVLKYNPDYEHPAVTDISKCRKNPWSALQFAGDAKSKYEKVFVHSADYLLMAAFFVRGVPCYFFQHGMAVSHGMKLKRQLKKYWFSLLPVIFKTKIICSSGFAANKSRSLGIKMAEERICVIPFGTDISRREGIKVRTGNQPVVVGTAGRLVEIKRFNTLLESLIDYPFQQEIELRIAGEGSEKKKLVKISSKITSPHVTVKFLGVVHDMESFYDDLDLFLFPSHNESYGLVVLEALYRNVPVALFKDIGGALDLIEDGKNGFVLGDIEDGYIKLWESLNEKPAQIEKMKKYISDLNLRRYSIIETRNIIEQIR